MEHKSSSVSLVSDLDQLERELSPQQMWLVQPTVNRKYPQQRMTMTAEIVDITTINLADLSTLEVL